MARIRTIKPEFWEDEVVGMLSMGARLLFIASWNLADDEGLLRWTPEYLKAAVFMYDDALTIHEAAGFMKELEEAQLVFPYIGGKSRQRLGWIVKFLRHQKINKPQPGRLPPPSLQSYDVRMAYAARDGWICRVCGRAIGNDPVTMPIDDLASCDHVTPQSKGGSDYPSNIRATHLRCNKSKKDKTLSDSLSDSRNDSRNDTDIEDGNAARTDSVPEGKGMEGSQEGIREQDTETTAPASLGADVGSVEKSEVGQECLTGQERGDNPDGDEPEGMAPEAPAPPSTDPPALPDDPPADPPPASYERPAYTLGELADLARTKLGLGEIGWGDQQANYALLNVWLYSSHEKRDPLEIALAIEGAADMRDRDLIGWDSARPGMTMTLRALVHAATLADQGDGKAVRTLYDVAVEYQRKRESEPRRAPTTKAKTTGMQRLDVRIPA